MTGSSPMSAAKGHAATQTPKAIIPTEIKNESTLSMIGPFLQSANNMDGARAERWVGAVVDALPAFGSRAAAKVRRLLRLIILVRSHWPYDQAVTWDPSRVPAFQRKSFGPIGRHARIYALPDWIVGHADSGRDWNPTPCSEVSDPYRSRARHGVSYSSSTVIKSPSHGGPSGPYGI